MTVEIVRGDLFESKADALVNPVNCVGVMGAGVAKQFMERYPHVCQQFNSMCIHAHLKPRPGSTYWYPVDNTSRFVIMFTTKDHWRNPSKLQWVVSGLAGITDGCKKYGLKSVAMPAIGCGHGGLSWEDQVKPAILDEFEDSDIHIEVRLQ